MLQWKKKKKIKPNETILDSEKFMYVEEEQKEEETPAKPQIDYTVLPHSETGRIGLICSIIALGFLIAFAVLLYMQGKEPQLNATVMAACAILWSIAGVFFAWRGVKIKNRNYRHCYVAFGIAGVQLMTWIITLILTSRR